MASNLLVRPAPLPGDPQVATRVPAGRGGCSQLGFEVRALATGDTWSHDTGGDETIVVLLAGRCSVEIEFRGERRHWSGLERASVFTTLPTAVHLSPGSRLHVSADSDLELAHGWTPSRAVFAPRLVRPDECGIEIRGGGNATRQITAIVPPEAPGDRLLCLEVLTPAGNSSSYPPHKHDVHAQGADGALIEADLDEIYYYRIDRARGEHGYAVQRVYTDDRRLDETIVAHHGDVVLVPEGYHPVAAAHGYDCYYLNFLAGSARSLACRDDPAHAWVRATWTATDPRLPMVAKKAGARV